MNKIPTFNIKSIKQILNINTENNNYFLHHFNINNSPKFEMCRLGIYFIALLHKGEILVETDLIKNTIKAPAIATISPSVIRKFMHSSDDFESEVIYFDKTFFTENLADANYLDKYEFFNNQTKNLSTLDKESYEEISQYFSLIKRQEKKSEKSANDIVRNLIQILLSEIAILNRTEKIKKYSHNELIFSNFKIHLEKYFKEEKKVSFYASLQHLTSKYFSSIIKQQSGKSAGEVLDDRIIFEAKLSLHQKELTIAQIADQLNFNDNSHFIKFFKKKVGKTPFQYRQETNL